MWLSWRSEVWLKDKVCLGHPAAYRMWIVWERRKMVARFLSASLEQYDLINCIGWFYF